MTGVCLKIGAEVCECVCVEALQTIARVKQVPQPLIWCMIHIQHIYEMRNGEERLQIMRAEQINKGEIIYLISGKSEL